jgi:hypothetical protein
MPLMMKEEPHGSSQPLDNEVPLSSDQPTSHASNWQTLHPNGGIVVNG